MAEYRRATLVCSALVGLIALLTSMAVPESYFVEARVLVVEPVAIHRLANPFAPVPSSRDELVDVPETLRSRAQLEVLIKRTGLLEMWDAGRPWPLRFKDQLMTKLRGPVSDADRVDALVALLEKRLVVSLDGNRVHFTVEWSTPELAVALVKNSIEALKQLRTTRDIKVLQEAAESLDRQYQAVREEIDLRAKKMEADLKDPGGALRVEGAREQLFREQSRAAELLVAAEEKHITADVFREANDLRFTELKHPVPPKHPQGQAPLARIAVGLAASVLAGIIYASLLKVGKMVWPSRNALLLGGGIAFATGVAVAVSKGNVLFSMVPPVLFVGGWLLWTQPLKWPVMALLFFSTILDDPADRPYVGLWQSPLWPVGKAFFTNIAQFTGSEIAILGLAALMLVRRTLLTPAQAEALDPVKGQPPRILQLSLVISGVVVVLLVVMGIARGGIFREALWQFRALLMMPIFGMLAMYALDLPKDLPKLVGILVVGSIVKSLLGTYFMYFIAYPQAEYPPHTTGHNDTMIFVTAVVTAIALFWEKPSRKHMWMFLLWMPFVAIALKLNDRRVAYVDIGMGLALLYIVSPWHQVKRSLTRGFIAMLPVLMLYFAVGWNAKSSVFGPVQKVRSIVAPEEGSDEEGSNVERDIENFNIMKTWYQNMTFGQGFGHAFIEWVPVNDFAQSAFGHIGHNSILWLLWIGGIVGFTGVLGYLAVGIYFLGRTIPRVTDWRERAALYVSLSVVVTYLMQAFGDMGTQSVMFDFFVGTSMAIVGRLATKASVWKPAPLGNRVPILAGGN